MSTIGGMTFYLKRMPNGRVYISQIEPTKDEELLSKIEANTWIEARETCRIDGHEMYTHKKGYGYF